MNIFITLSFLTVYAITLAKLAKKGIEPGFIFGVPQLAGYLFFGYQVAHFTPFHPIWANVLVGFLLSIWATAFTVGVSFLTTNVLSVEEGTLILNEEHPFTPLVSKHVDGKSLCQLSWLLSLAVFLLPVLALLLVLISFVMGICAWFGTGVNFFTYFKAACTLKPLPYCRDLKFDNGAPKAPLLYTIFVAIVGGLCYGVYKLVTSPSTLLGIGHIILVCSAIAVALFVLWKVYDFTLTKSVDVLYNRKDQYPQDVAYDIEWVHDRRSKKQNVGFVDYVEAFGQVFLYKYCPKIVVRSNEEPEDEFEDDGEDN
jgi:hypothetical protein